MDQHLIDLYHKHVGMGFDRQLRFTDFLARRTPGSAWKLDIGTARLTFGGKLVFEAPVIGSHARHNDSWLWAGANRNLRLSLTNRALCDTVRALASRLMVGAFAATTFPINQHIGDELTPAATDVFGVVLVEELEYDAYYKAPYEGGTALHLIRDDRLQVVERHPVARVLEVFPQLIKALPVPDHRAALTSYARSYGLAVVDIPGGIKVTGPGGELSGTFDDRGRLAKLEGNVTVPRKPVPRPGGPKVKAGLAKAAKASLKKKAPAARAAGKAAKSKPAVRPARAPAKVKPAANAKAAKLSSAKPMKAAKPSKAAKPMKAAKPSKAAKSTKAMKSSKATKSMSKRGIKR